jgi:hypothetical protein
MSFTEYDEVIYMKAGAPVPYKMEFYYRDSLTEIKVMLQNHMYHDTSTISEHLVFLEHLADRLQQIISNEQSAGESATVLRKQLAEIKNLNDVLHSKLKGLNGAS